VSRFRKEVVLNKPEDFVNFIIKDFMEKEGFKYTVYNGENVWQLGHGWVASPQFIKTTYVNGVLTLEAWIKFAWLPGVYSGEMDLEGFFGALVKSALKEKINSLIKLLEQPLPDEAYKSQGTENGESPDYQNAIRREPIPVKTHDTSKNAQMGFVFGLVSLIGCVFPVGGILFGTLSIFYAKSGLNSSKNSMAITGIIISILMIIISFIGMILNILEKIRRITS